MTWIIVFLLAASVLIFLEVLLPGGILGLLAAGFLIAATVQTGLVYDWITAGFVFIASMLVGLGLVVLEFKIFAKTRFGKRFFLTRTVEGRSRDAASLDNMIGKTGLALTRLNPSGKVEIENQIYEAQARDGYLESGSAITVIAQDNFKLIIQQS
jgi:membrane-bound serine protease (ClpP class)